MVDSLGAPFASRGTRSALRGASRACGGRGATWIYVPVSAGCSAVAGFDRGIAAVVVDLRARMREGVLIFAPIRLVSRQYVTPDTRSRYKSKAAMVRGDRWCAR